MIFLLKFAFIKLIYFSSDLSLNDWVKPSIFENGAGRSASKDREPLAPDYKDPSAQASEDKPVNVTGILLSSIKRIVEGTKGLL